VYVFVYFRWKFSTRDCPDDLVSLGLKGKEMFSYAIENCTIFSEAPDAIDVSKIRCSKSVSYIDQCELVDDIELLQLCDNNMGSLCITIMLMIVFSYWPCYWA
jgi:hypothetical protein